jgi:four helix bundle protein
LGSWPNCGGAPFRLQNIAEGNGRRTTKDYVSFLYIARGSLAELRTQLTLARKLGYLPESAEITTLADEIGRILNGLIASLKARQRGV